MYTAATADGENSIIRFFFNKNLTQKILLFLRSQIFV